MSVMTEASIRLPSVDLGNVRVSLMSGGSLRLDGGAMFGIVPKTLWGKLSPPDEENRIFLTCNCLLIEWPGSDRRVIVEAGVGDKYPPKELSMFAIDPQRTLVSSLRADGIDPASITDIILTHMHFDHAGGLTRTDADGRLAFNFPRARVHVQKRELEDARAKFGLMINTYREENITPVDEHDAWHALDGDAPVADCVRVLSTFGHTRGHQAVLVEGADRSLLFTGDVMPTRSHVGRSYGMGFDLYPLENSEAKGRLLREAVEKKWLIALPHDPLRPLATAHAERDWYVLKGETQETLA